jgi:hypothetical protein
MKNKFSVFRMLVTALALCFVFIGCDNGNGSNDPMPPSVAYLNEKNWVCNSGEMPSGVTSIIIAFSGSNQWTETMYGGIRDGKNAIGTYTVSGLTITLTVTGGTLTEAIPGHSYTATFDATQAANFTVQGQNLVFSRTGGGGQTSPAAAYLNEKSWTCTSGDMPSGVTSITISFSGTNQWTETMYGGTRDGKNAIGTYTVSGLTITLTVTGGTLTEAIPGQSYTATFDTTQATNITIPNMNVVFYRQQ